MHAALLETVDDWQPAPLWLVEQQLASLCPHCDNVAEDLEPDSDPVQWAIPGVTGLDRPEPEALPAPSPAVAALIAAYDRVRSMPTSSSDAQALVDAEALLGLGQRLHVDSVGLVADVGRRGLQELVGFRSLRAWLRARRPDGEASDATLGMALGDYPVLQAAVEDGNVPLSSARRVVKALALCWRELDRPDGLIDDQPGDQVLPAVVGNAIGLICRYLNGLHDDDPRLAMLIERGQRILEGAPSQRSQVEATLTLLAEHVPPRSLAAHLDELVLSLLPSRLDDAAAKGHANRGLVLKRKADGSGWQLSGELDLECGERLFTALRAEATRDPDNPADTLAWQQQRDRDAAPCPFTGQPATAHPEFAQAGAPAPADVPGWFELAAIGSPRSRPHRLHDALNRLLARYLDQGMGGTLNKLPVQIAVTITEPTLTGQPGAAPARAESGALIPGVMVRRWWCDSTVTAFVVSLGGKALRAVHGQRTLSGLERKALQLETGGRCAGRDCCPDQPDPLQTLIPHHTQMFSKHGRTSLDETLNFCLRSHQDLHEGKRTILLRDGRYLNEHGFTAAPPWPPSEPPF